MPQGQTPASFAWSFGSAEAVLHPLAYVENPPTAKEQVFNWFLPGLGALTAWLRNAGFAEVEVIEVKDDRAVVVCRKAQGETPPPDALHHFVARLTLQEGPPTSRPSSDVAFRVSVENVGLTRWPAAGDEATDRGAVHLGSHLLRDTEEEVQWDYGRAHLPRTLEPGGTVTLELTVRAPAAPGRYIVEFDMVAEHITWFEDHGAGTLRHELLVE